MNKSLVVHPNGLIDEVALPDAEALRSMYLWLGCTTVDVVSLTDQLDMWLDDEGVFRQEINPLATRLAQLYGFVSQSYFGPALLCSRTEDGESVNLTPEQLAAVRTQLERA